MGSGSDDADAEREIKEEEKKNKTLQKLNKVFNKIKGGTSAYKLKNAIMKH